MSKPFKIDIAFTNIIKEWFDQLKLSFVLIGIDSEENAKPEKLLQTKFFEKKIIAEFPAKLGVKGNIESKNDVCFIFDNSTIDKSKIKNKKIIQIKYFPVLLCAVKTITPAGNEYFTFNKIIKPEYEKILSFKKESSK